MTLGLRFMPDLAEWVEGALRKSGLSQKELAERLSEKVGRPIYQTMISKMIRGARKPDFDEVLGISIITAQPLPLRNIGSRVIPVSGAIRDGGIVLDYKSPVDFVEVPPDGTTNVLAYEVLGTNAATGVAYDGWIVYVSEDKHEADVKLAGKAVLAQLEHGPVTLKMAEKSSAPGKLDLRSTLTGEVLRAPKVEWLRTVEWIKPR